MQTDEPYVDFWDLYFTTKLMPELSEWLHVDVDSSSRYYRVIKYMGRLKQLYIVEEDDIIERISITQIGIRYYNRAKLTFADHEEEGKAWVALLDKEWIDKTNK